MRENNPHMQGGNHNTKTELSISVIHRIHKSRINNNFSHSENSVFWLFMLITVDEYILWDIVDESDQFHDGDLITTKGK